MSRIRLRSSAPGKAILFVALVALCAVAVGFVTSLQDVGWREPSLGVCAVFVLLIAATDRLAVRFDHSGSVERICAIEGLCAPLIFSASGTRTVVVVAAGVVLAQIVNRNDPIKGLFNVAQWVIAVSVGIAVYRSLGLPHDGSIASIAGLTLALVAVVVVNQILMSAVIWIATGHRIARVDIRSLSIVHGRVVSFLFNAVLGLIATSMFFWQPWAIVVVAVPLFLLHTAGQAEVAMRGNQMRLLAMHRAGHHLSASVDAESIHPFLDEVRAGFEVEELHLVLFGEDGTTSYVAGREPVAAGRGVPLAEHLATQITTPMHVDAGKPGDAAALLAAMGRRRALVAPLVRAGQVSGMLLLLDRLGPEGFQAGELAVAGALAREVLGFFDRVQLVDAIEDERRKLADVVEHTGDGIISVDVDGVVVSWNAGMAAITGYTAEEMVGTRHLNLLRARDAQGNDRNVAGWSTRVGDGDGGIPRELQITTSDGSLVWLSCSFSRIPGRDGRPDALIIVARNITQARELELLKDDFIAVVSHELRTPLVPIKGWAQTLLSRGDRLNEEQRRTAVQSILSQAQRLEALVLNILESSRVEAGNESALDVVDVDAVTHRVVEDLVVARPDREIRVRPSAATCRVSGSPVWVERAISNLVANAVKYSPDDEPVDVVVSTLRGDVLVSVTDRGPGIAADSQERIFERFERLEESRKQTGTGLGLYITRQLARAMGGDVTVSSLPGAGSTFVLRLPLADRAAAVADALPAPRSDASDVVVRLG